MCQAGWWGRPLEPEKMNDASPRALLPEQSRSQSERSFSPGALLQSTLPEHSEVLKSNASLPASFSQERRGTCRPWQAENWLWSISYLGFLRVLICLFWSGTWKGRDNRVTVIAWGLGERRPCSGQSRRRAPESSAGAHLQGPPQSAPAWCPHAGEGVRGRGRIGIGWLSQTTCHRLGRVVRTIGEMVDESENTVFLPASSHAE